MTHFCLISHELLPNLLPVLDPLLRPDKVVMAVSDQMLERAGWLEKELLEKGIAVEKVRIENAHQISQLEETFLSWLKEHADEKVLLNVTGGTKPMAIAAQEAFGQLDKPVFYVNVQNDEVMWLRQKYPSNILEPKILLKNVLAVHGYTIDERENNKASAAWNKLSVTLGKKAGDWVSEIAVLKSYCDDAQSTGRLDQGKISPPDCPSMQKVLQLLYECKITSSPHRLMFVSKSACQFIKSDWLEYYAYNVVKSMASTQDVRMDVNIISSRGVRNQLDVAFLARNRLFLVECKVFSFAKSSSRDLTEAIYQLETLGKTGGLRTRGVLVSYKDIGKLNKERAREAGLTTIDFVQLPHLRQELEKIIA